MTTLFAVLTLLDVVVIAGAVMREACASPRRRIYFDNGTHDAVRIEVDERTVTVAQPRSASGVDLRLGPHRISIFSASGELIEDVAIYIPEIETKWVYNVARRNRYQVHALAYGNRARPYAVGRTPVDIGDNARFFQLPRRTSLFLPAEYVSPKDIPGTEVLAVSHAESHDEHTCCANLRDLKRRVQQLPA